MMVTTAQLDLAIWRNDDAYEFPLRVVGPNLTGVLLRAQIRVDGDIPGAPLVALETVTHGTAQGLRLAGVTQVGGIYQNDVRIRLSRSTRQALPYSGEVGTAATLSWALAIGGRTRIQGRVFVLAHVMDSDAAPVRRPAGGSAPGASPVAPEPGATLTISQDGGATLTIDGADLVAGMVADAAASSADAQSASGRAVAAAETALAASLATPNVYPSTAAGLAGVAEGGYFVVPGAAGSASYGTIYRKVSGAAVPGPSAPSRQALDSALAALAAFPAITDRRVLSRMAILEDLARQALPSLTTAGASYHAIHSTTRLVPTYSGPAFTVRRADGIFVDLGYTGRSVLPGDIQSLRGSASALRLSRWYDQSGAGRDMTQGNADYLPGLHEDAYQQGAPVVFLDGNANFEGGPTRGLTFAHALDSRAATIFFVTDLKASAHNQALVAWDANTGDGPFLYHGQGPQLGAYDPAGNTVWPGRHFRVGPAVHAYRFQNGPIDLFIDGTRFAGKSASDGVSTGPTPSAKTLTTGRLGYVTNPALQSYNLNGRILAMVAVAGALNDQDVLAITRALQSNFGVPSRQDARVVLIGDSIAEGGASSNTLELFWYLSKQDLNVLPEFYSFSLSGKTLAQCYQDRAVYDATAYRPGEPIVYIIEAGTNDLKGGGQPSDLYATLTGYVSYLKNLGPNVRVVVNTLLKVSSAFGYNDKIDAYNARVRGNAAGADAINDVAAEPRLVASNVDTDRTILGDGLHPTSLGYALQAPIYADTLNGLLRLAPSVS